MHSLPTPSSRRAVKCVTLKHKLPARHARLATTAMAPTTMTATTTGMTTTATTPRAPTARPRVHVDDDLLETVLRVALETRLRRERLRKRASGAATVLQQAVAALHEEPAVGQQLTAHKAQFGFRDAFGQLSRLHRQY